MLTELPHDLSVDSRVELINIKSGVNTTGAGNSGFNGTFHVTGITSAREFTVGIATDPDHLQAYSNENYIITTFKRKNYEKLTLFKILKSYNSISRVSKMVFTTNSLNATNRPLLIHLLQINSLKMLQIYSHK